MPAKLLITLLALILPLAAHPDPSHTLEHLNEHLAEKPDDLALLAQKAQLFLNTDHPKQARPVVEKLLKLHPTKDLVLLLEARLLLDEKKSAAAKEKATALTIAHPDFAPGWKFLSRVAEQSGDREAAITAMRRSLTLDPKPSPTDVMTCAAWLRDRAKPGDAEAAISLLDQGLAKLGVLTGLHFEAIQLETTLGRHDAALRRIDALTTRFRPSVDLSLRRATILEKAGRHQEAAAACDSALALLDLLPANSKKSPDYKSRVQETTRRKEANLAKVPAAPHDS
jgi:predicted Zn-dependent protease